MSIDMNNWQPSIKAYFKAVIASETQLCLNDMKEIDIIHKVAEYREAIFICEQAFYKKRDRIIEQTDGISKRLYEEATSQKQTQ